VVPAIAAAVKPVAAAGDRRGDRAKRDDLPVVVAVASRTMATLLCKPLTIADHETEVVKAHARAVARSGWRMTDTPVM
jgi:hypothetical protein